MCSEFISEIDLDNEYFEHIDDSGRERVTIESIEPVTLSHNEITNFLTPYFAEVNSRQEVLQPINNEPGMELVDADIRRRTTVTRFTPGEEEDQDDANEEPEVVLMEVPRLPIVRHDSLSVEHSHHFEDDKRVSVMEKRVDKGHFLFEDDLNNPMRKLLI